jgi:hypothetical protein
LFTGNICTGTAQGCRLYSIFTDTDNYSPQAEPSSPLFEESYEVICSFVFLCAQYLFRGEKRDLHPNFTVVKEMTLMVDQYPSQRH